MWRALTPNASARQLWESVPDVPLRILSVCGLAGHHRYGQFARHFAESLEPPKRLVIVTNLGNHRLPPGRIVTGELVAIERTSNGAGMPIFVVTI